MHGEEQGCPVDAVGEGPVRKFNSCLPKRHSFSNQSFAISFDGPAHGLMPLRYRKMTMRSC